MDAMLAACAEQLRERHEEIKEVLLQVATYCGVPAGIDSFRIAREAFAELEAKPK